MVGDVAERWTASDHEAIREAEAWLVTVTTRRALDVLRSARLRRVDYPGVWLPEPIATGADPSVDVERVESLTMGFLLPPRATHADRAGRVRAPRCARPAVRRRRGRRRSDRGGLPAGGEPGPSRTSTCRCAGSPAERAHAEEVAYRFMAVGLGGDVDALLARAGARRGRHERRRRRRARRHASGDRSAPRRPGCWPTSLPAPGDDPLVVPCELNGGPGALVHVADGWIGAGGGRRRRPGRRTCGSSPTRRSSSTSWARSPQETAGRPGAWDAPGRFRNRGGQSVR